MCRIKWIFVCVFLFYGCVDSKKQDVVGSASDIDHLVYLGLELINTKACTPFQIRMVNDQDQTITADEDISLTISSDQSVNIFQDDKCENQSAIINVPKSDFRGYGYIQASTIGNFELSYKEKSFASIEVAKFSPLFSQALDGEVTAIFPNPSGQTDVIVSGNFTQILGEQPGDLVKINIDGSLNLDFIRENGVSGAMYDLVPFGEDSKDMYLIGPGRYNNIKITGLGKVFANGNLDPLFSEDQGSIFTGTMRAGAIDDQGRIVVGGRASKYGDQTIHGLVRLTPDAQLEDFVVSDELFDFTLTSLAGIHDIKIDKNQDIYVAGSFTNFGASSLGNIARMNQDGTKDAAFNANFSGYTTSIDFASDGKIYVGGSYTVSKGISQKRLARLNTSGEVDTTFLQAGQGFDTRVEVVRVDDQDRIYVGGIFTMFNEAPVSTLVRLLTDGTIDPDFTPTLNGPVKTIEFANDSSGDIWVGGSFTQVNGQAQNYLVRLDDQGNLD